VWEPGGVVGEVGESCEDGCYGGGDFYCEMDWHFELD